MGAESSPKIIEAPLDHGHFRTLSHFDGLNGIRCVAIVGVIWHHCYHGPAQWAARGFLGVDLFFVLSGFLITTLLLRERDATGTISLGRFWIRRCLRLMPALYLLIAVLTLYHILVPGGPGAASFFGALPANLFYYSNWTADRSAVPGLWSLATEEQFYLVWPLIEALAAALAWPLLALVMLANLALGFGWLDPWLAERLANPLASYEIVSATYMPICLGIVLARLLHRERSYTLLTGALGRRGAPWIALLVALLIIGWGPGEMRGWPRLAVQLAMMLLIGAVVVRPSGRMVRLLEWRVAVRIGTISYGLYLYHIWTNQIGWRIAHPLGYHPDLLLFVLTLGFGVLVAEISYRGLEAPMLRLAHRFRARRGAIIGDTGEAPS